MGVSGSVTRRKWKLVERNGSVRRRKWKLVGGNGSYSEIEGDL